MSPKLDLRMLTPARSPQPTPRELVLIMTQQMSKELE